ncbi:MAG: SDR family NAD(P)-dependent oxidoreductase, partial [Kangiellaceae bacterium]|nr:SDR family NAD(P)-dependent oxidoreductase [Kangiellaceae bacterium]
MRAAFLSNIDRFDHEFFGLSKQEANMMAPEQRLFLETAWHALEDAGYGGNSIKGSNTGVFAGISNDFGESYRHLIDTVAPDAPEISVVGNINSVIACRLAYLLDLKGPTMLVDTACSSSLVALHLACRSLRSGECDMALVGTVNISLVPLLLESTTGVGVKDIQDNFAADSHTKTFDELSDGMSIGEGVLVFALKPLEKALEDGDQVHAVVRGSAINQDGQSVGLTAPNSNAQAELIQSAWRDAGVTAREVSYIEAHGTGTKLGDPVEISGIQQAFKQATTRKQFCGVGSVKSNIGHLDNAAGLAGLAKVVLSMKYGKLPASLNFRQPNRQILFEQSPVYVNDRLNEWLPSNAKSRDKSGASQQKLIAGVSSYGLSGTNCHVVLQSANNSKKEKPENDDTQSYLLPLSAKTDIALKQLARDYLTFLESNSKIKPKDLSFTASTGRLHHKRRVALVYSSVNELVTQLSHFIEGDSNQLRDRKVNRHFEKQIDFKDKDINTGVHSSTGSQEQDEFKKQELTEKANQLLKHCLADGTKKTERKSNLTIVARYYCGGAEPNWEQWFEGTNAARISIPVYPFADQRCWVETTGAGEALAANRNGGVALNHPLLSQVLESKDFSLYRVTLSATSHWELSDHKVQGSYVLPGTCYVEMMLAVADRLNKGDKSSINFGSIQFLSPFIVEDYQHKELHLQLIGGAENYEIKICSQGNDGGWQEHALAKLSLDEASINQDEIPESENMGELLSSLPVSLELTSQDDLDRGLEIGGRWYNSLKQSWCNAEQTEYLVELSLSKTYVDEIQDYQYHPALLDTAINAANHIGGSGDLYLPFFYRGLRIYTNLPGNFFVHLIRTSEPEGEVVTFQAKLMDSLGKVCATVERYGIKKATQFEMLNRPNSSVNTFCLNLIANERAVETEEKFQIDMKAQAFLVVHNGEKEQLALVEFLRNRNAEVIELRQDRKDYITCLAKLNELSLELSGIIYAAGWQCLSRDESNCSLLQLMTTVNSIVQQKLSYSGNFLVLTQHAFGEEVNPMQAAIASFSRIASLENPQMSLLCLDIQTLEFDEICFQLQEPKTNSQGHAKIIREGHNLYESLELVEIPQTLKPLRLKDEGVYFISGGCGALGLELALEMAAQAKSQGLKIKLVLTTTTELPESKEWPTLIDSEESPQKLGLKLEKLLAISKLGVDLDCVVLDITDNNQTQLLLQALREKSGPISGVVHAAGRAGDGFLINKSSEDLQRVVSPKIQGALNLHQLTKTDPLDFFVMYSSIAGVCHEAGQSDYTAANRFLDALATERRREGLPGLSIAWPAWRETGIAVEYGAVNEDEIFLPINTKEALQALLIAISAGSELPPSVVISSVNPQATVQDFESLNLACSEEVAAMLKSDANESRGMNSNLGKSNVNTKHTDLIGISKPDKYDLMVAKVWGQVLDKSELHIDDSFNDLGGNSILTTQKYQAFEELHSGVIDM